MEEIFVEIAKHSFVVAMMFAMFLVILYLVYTIIASKLETNKTANDTKFDSLKHDIDTQLASIKTNQDSENAKLTVENKMITDKLHSLGTSVTNCVTQIGQTDRKIDLILVHLGTNPIKMAQDK
jgi:peptidoglycan hydrolase CwlO-like protein